MKNCMSRPILSLITGFLLLSLFGQAQNIEIKVLNTKSQPLHYAFILINSRPQTISDTSGIALIPINKLKINDTISVSYLGTSPLWITYDSILQESKSHCFYLDESGFELNELVVVYVDQEKLFKKSIKDISEINYNCFMTAQFTATVTEPHQLSRNLSGTFKVENELWSKKFTARKYGWFHHPITFNTNSDSSSISQMLDYHTHFALNIINMALLLSRQKPNTIYKPSYSYLGEKENYKVFRISYPQANIVGCPYQIIISVDKNTKQINSAKIEAINTDPKNNKNFEKVIIEFNCNPFEMSSSKMNTVYLPSDIRYSAHLHNGTNIEMMITNPTLGLE